MVFLDVPINPSTPLWTGVYANPARASVNVLSSPNLVAMPPPPPYRGEATPNSRAFHGLHCLLTSLRVPLAIRLFTGSQFPYLSLPGSGKVASLVVLGFIAGSCWAIGVRLGRGFYLWFMLACSQLCGRPHSATHSFICVCRDMGPGERGGSRATSV